MLWSRLWLSAILLPLARAACRPQLALPLCRFELPARPGRETSPEPERFIFLGDTYGHDRRGDEKDEREFTRVPSLPYQRYSCHRYCSRTDTGRRGRSRGRRMICHRGPVESLRKSSPIGHDGIRGLGFFNTGAENARCFHWDGNLKKQFFVRFF